MQPGELDINYRMLVDISLGDIVPYSKISYILCYYVRVYVLLCRRKLS